MGDANQDGKLNIRDATIIQKYLAKIETFYNYAIGVAEPTSVMVDTFGTGVETTKKMEDIVYSVFGKFFGNIILFLILVIFQLHLKRYVDIQVSYLLFYMIQSF